MDPFIEGCGLWEDFHGHMVEKIFDILADAVPANYVVRTGERGYVVLAEAETQTIYSFKPDVSVTTDQAGAPGAESATAVAEKESGTAPFSVRAFIEEEFRETFVEISEASGEGRLVTSIEVPSPTNKRLNSPGWDLYQRKRQGLFLGHSANLVEIDLLRAGQRMPTVDRLPGSPYIVSVARKFKMPYCQVWDAYFDRRLPPVPVPLSKPDGDVTLDLQPIIDAIYARARYHRSIDYSRPLTPPLTADETAWLEQKLRQRA
jgi:hypothetical protein